MSNKAEINAHLAEYTALRTEVDHYSKRIDAIIVIYLTVAFALSGFLLQQVGTLNLHEHVTEILASDEYSMVLLFVAVVNSAIVLQVMNFYIAILSIAQYTQYVIASRIALITGSSVMQWDSKNMLSSKKLWMSVRPISQSVFVIINIGVSLSIIYVVSDNWNSLNYVMILFWFSVVVLAASVYVGAKVVIAGRRFHRP